MITKRGVGLLLTAIMLFLLAGATNVGWVRIFDAVLWGMLLLSLLLQWLSVTKVEVTRRLLAIHSSRGWDAPMEEDAVEVEVTLHNGWFWPRFFVSLSYDAPMESPDSRVQRLFVANLKGHEDVSVVSRIRCYRRGLHRFGPVTIESQAPFGLFRKRKHRPAPLSLLVYPRAYDMRSMALLQSPRGESSRPQRSRGGQEVVGSREYYQGDPLRHIHWRNTARLGKLAVKELEDTAEKAVTIVLDPGRNFGSGRETTLEYGVKLAASVGLHVIGAGESVRLLADHLRGEWADPEAFLNELALLEPSESSPLSETLAGLTADSNAVVIVSAADHDGLRALADHAGRLAGIAAVVLGGFTEEDHPAAAADALLAQGIPTANCVKGSLQECISQLEALGPTAATPYQHATR